MMNVKIGITGSRGFIGSELAGHLESNGFKVVKLDGHTRQESGENEKSALPKGLKWVLHFAASTSIEESRKDPFRTYRNNIDSTLAAIEIAKESKAALLFMSSYVYGNPKYVPIDEDHPLGAVNPYMSSKIICEDICRQVSKLMSIPLVILRGSNIYGKTLIKGRLIPDLLESAKKGEQLTITDPLPRRDYLYIRDFCGLIIKILDNDPPIQGTFNAGQGQSYSNKEVAEIVRRLSSNKYPVAVNGPKRENDIKDASINVSLVKKTFMWEPSYSLEDGLKELIGHRKRGLI